MKYSVMVVTTTGLAIDPLICDNYDVINKDVKLSADDGAVIAEFFDVQGYIVKEVKGE